MSNDTETACRLCQGDGEFGEGDCPRCCGDGVEPPWESGRHEEDTLASELRKAHEVYLERPDSTKRRMPTLTPPPRHEDTQDEPLVIPTGSRARGGGAW